MLIPAALLLLSMGFLLCFPGESHTADTGMQLADLYDGPDLEEDEYIRPLQTAAEDFYRTYEDLDITFLKGESYQIQSPEERDFALQLICRQEAQFVLAPSKEGLQIKPLAEFGASEAFVQNLKQRVEASLRCGDQLIQLFYHHTSGKNQSKHKPAGWAVLGEVGIHYSRGLRYHSLLMPQGIPGEQKYRETEASMQAIVEEENLAQELEGQHGEYFTVLGPLRLFGPGRKEVSFRPGLPAALRISEELGLLTYNAESGMGIAGEAVK